MATRLLLIRHAHVDTGDPPVLCGTLDLPLSRKGQAQLRACRFDQFFEASPSALYTSPLRRARDTALAIGETLGIAPVSDDDLAEIHCGVLEGLPIARIERDYPELWRRNLEQANDRFTWPGGESYASFRHRIIRGFTRIAASHPNVTVAIVTHAGVVAQLVGLVKGRAAAVWEHDRPGPLTRTELTWHNDSPVALGRFNVPATFAEPMQLHE